MSKLIALLLAMIAATAPAWCREFKLALPGYQLQFPADHASHNDYRTEWWYYTGHLNGADGARYGYELTFFRSAMDVATPIKPSPWSVDNVYLAHFAVSDVTTRKFHHASKLNRSGIGFAGADRKNYYVWNQNWRAATTQNETHKLVASDGDYRLELNLVPLKKPALHGVNGLSQKASCRGCASYYYSLTRMETNGTLTKGGKPVQVTGVSWMDHEFGSNQLTPEQVGWDWFSLQLDDNSELMLYMMRRKDGGLDENSSGTYVLADGATKHLALNEYVVKSTGSWKSSESKATYPMGWKVSIPSLNADLEIVPELENQELVKRRESDVTYWEGTCLVRGSLGGKPVSGQAYVEMTGYAEIFSKKI
jgi:predicted secreted hydrolase